MRKNKTQTRSFLRPPLCFGKSLPKAGGGLPFLKEKAVRQARAARRGGSRKDCPSLLARNRKVGVSVSVVFQGLRKMESRSATTCATTENASLHTHPKSWRRPVRESKRRERFRHLMRGMHRNRSKLSRKLWVLSVLRTQVQRSRSWASTG